MKKKKVAWLSYLKYRKPKHILSKFTAIHAEELYNCTSCSLKREFIIL